MPRLSAVGIPGIHAVGGRQKVRAEKRGFALVHSNGSEHVINLSKVQTPSQWGELERGLKQVFDKAVHTCSD